MTDLERQLAEARADLAEPFHATPGSVTSGPATRPEPTGRVAIDGWGNHWRELRGGSFHHPAVGIVDTIHDLEARFGLRSIRPATHPTPQTTSVGASEGTSNERTDDE